MKLLFKKIYAALPFKKQLFSVVKYFFNLPLSVYQHLHFEGFFTVHIDKDHQFEIYHPGTIEENEIFWNGLYHGWEKRSIRIWTHLAKVPGQTIFDIGANTGLYALVAASLEPSHTIHCFEPLPGVFKTLEKNIEKNKLKIKSHLVGLSDYDGKAKVYLPAGSEFAYSVTVNKNTLSQKNVDEVEIDVIKLSTFIQKNNITSIDLMKIDVETHEVEVLTGMGDYLRKFKPTIIIEVLNDSVAEKLNPLFEGLDYLYFNIDDEKNSIRKVNKITKSDHWNFLVCNKSVAEKLELI